MEDIEMKLAPCNIHICRVKYRYINLATGETSDHSTGWYDIDLIPRKIASAAKKASRLGLAFIILHEDLQNDVVNDDGVQEDLSSTRYDYENHRTIEMEFDDWDD